MYSWFNRKKKKHCRVKRKKSRKKELSYETMMKKKKRKRTVFRTRRISKQEKKREERFCGRLSRQYRIGMHAYSTRRALHFFFEGYSQIQNTEYNHMFFQIYIISLLLVTELSRHSCASSLTYLFKLLFSLFSLCLSFPLVYQ